MSEEIIKADALTGPQITDGVYRSKEPAGFDVFTAESYYYDSNFKPCEREKGLALILKSNGITKWFLRYGARLQDRDEKPKEKFLEVDEQIFGLYKGYLVQGNYAGFTMANQLISERGFN